MVVEGQDGGQVLYVVSKLGTCVSGPPRTSPSTVLIFGLLQGFFGVPDGEAVSVCVSAPGGGGGGGIVMSRRLAVTVASAVPAKIARNNQLIQLAIANRQGGYMELDLPRSRSRLMAFA